MINYLNNAKKHAFEIPYIYFKFYSNILVPSCIDLDPCSNRGLVEETFRILKKVSEI